jgi:hypothetical protein
MSMGILALGAVVGVVAVVCILFGLTGRKGS